MATSKAHYASNPDYVKDTENGSEITFDPRGLNIVWGADSRYWRLPTEDNQPAELMQVSWLEVTGSTDKIELGKSYKIQFELSLKPDAFGWSGCQVYVLAKIGKSGRYKWARVPLKDKNAADGKFVTDPVLVEPPNDRAEKQLFFGLYEVWSGKWKGGLQIHKAIAKKQN